MILCTGELIECDQDLSKRSMARAVHRYPVPAPNRIPLRKIPVNTVSDFNGMLIGILQNNTTNGGTKMA